ncbi:GNAT family N-acetyltransferase [Kitasatospora sp. NPDC008050]|uniref:GNAT family N-acetyltransferase n=1 Tax=Kitasatospora sp. NPDC008050 TaxID=3364021 RepID=UPI0036E69E04
MRFRPTTETDLALVLDWDVAEPVAWITADRHREESAGRRLRPEWTWIAEEDGRVLGRALWWGRSDSGHPIVLDCLSVHPSVTDRAALAAELLATAHKAFAEQGFTAVPEYNIMLSQEGPHDKDARAAAVAWREDAARRAGLTEQIERLRFEWTPEAGTPGPSDRLVFTVEPDDEVFVEVFRQVARGSLDRETIANLASMGEEGAARDDLEFYLGCLGERDWWRIARTPDGRLAGFAIPSRTPYGPNVGYLGVVPELRGRRYIDDILAEITRSHVGRGAARITATTDTTNIPMAAAFRRGGYRVSETRVILAAPAA